jgi:hypothetical protein
MTEKEVADLRERVAVLESQSGKMALTPPAMMVAWVIALAVIASAGSAAVSAYQTKGLVEDVRVLAARLGRHEHRTIHPGARYEVNDLIRRVSELDKKPVREIPEAQDVP